ncbi:MAG: sugar ABC transporter permease [Thermomicrobiales bacterium]|nr:sugar ABC transporter permease [Thermomicrobiales bacterium]MCO5222020.1 sugar ABC transporter permease [Thermomicrobiales bacterium]
MQEQAVTQTTRPRALALSEEEHQRLQRRYQRRRSLTAYLFLLPGAIFFFAFLVIPILLLFFYTFNNGGIISEREWVGLANWRNVLRDDLVITAIKNTVVYCLMAIPAVFVISMVLALVLQQAARGGSAFRSLLYIPTLAPYVVAALLWQFVVHRDFGILNMILVEFGQEPRNWLGSPDLALRSITMLEVWRGVGFWTLLFLAGLIGLPKELYQAAAIDGANAWQRFRYLTIPLMRPTFFFAVVMATIWNLQLFDSVSILTNGGPQNSTVTVVWYIQQTTFAYTDKVGFGAALSFMLLLLILFLALIEIRLLRKR